ncbi:hypothetical protein VTN77DRAFT_9279 [Rasamsonia byssochlamydoides]|uniref:uncharacterized protein n=1 Tax=Rasamsonia byssochlamydoides TaxID=89139 RepID=UPI0037435D8B
MTTSCDAFHLVESGDTQSIASVWTSSTPEIQRLVTCRDLELGTYVCVDVLGSNSSSTTTTAPGNTISTPSPIQTGMVTDCDKFYDVQSGDTCAGIASQEGIPLSSLYAWNPAVGTSCADLYLSYYICVGVVATSTTSSPTSTSSGVVTPTPTQTGMVTDCDQFYLVQSGDTCASIVSAENISLSDFYSWNPAVGSSCQSLWLGYYVCVGVS